MKKIFFTILALVISIELWAQVKTTYHSNGQKASEGVLLNADASVLSPDFESLPKQTQADKLKNCPKDGKWTYWYANGQVSTEEFYKNGLMTGIWKGFYADGKPSFLINFETGESTNWFENGSIQSKGKVNSNMAQEGKWVIYYQNGQINTEGNYSNGQKTGVWTFYNESGKKTAEQTFQDGMAKELKNF